MITMDANRMVPRYELTSELARLGLAASRPQDRDRRLAWVNSVCILFLLIGVFGYKGGSAWNRPLPQMEEVVPAVVEPLPPPPQTAAAEQTQDQTDQEKPDAPQVVVVTMDSPAINFSVPTIGNLLVANAVAQAPPVAPLRAVAPLRRTPLVIQSTGSGGERPQPPYPQIALEQGEQGSVTLSLTVDDAGSITAIEVKQSSGFPVLDRSALEFVRRHWTVPPGEGAHNYFATIHYRLQQS
jgi:protein TonB